MAPRHTWSSAPRPVAWRFIHEKLWSRMHTDHLKRYSHTHKCAPWQQSVKYCRVDLVQFHFLSSKGFRLSSHYFPTCPFSITLSDGNNRNSLGKALAQSPQSYKRERDTYICIYTWHILTVFADIKLPEVDEVCDCCWQHWQIIIWHAQSVEYLAVK